ncbi:hypothetical protein B0H34DRAFT_719590 [Crassisporium funariophilum]|nr:hypothetical protein B0H34DRAFT_719590 [Crassisporium funariophilum]
MSETVPDARTPGWIPRRELALPNELLYKVILWAISDSVHSICVTTENADWSMSVVDILCAVSPAFNAISCEVAGKAFDIPPEVRDDESSLLLALRKIFAYLHRLGRRLRDPSQWESVSFQNIDCSVSSYVFAYALYLSCISLRRNASRSPRDVFESTHMVILSALTQSEALCDRVIPIDVTSLIRGRIQNELELARLGLVLVKAFHELNEHADSMLILQPSKEADGTGPLAAVRSLIHSSLSKIEAVHTRYAQLCILARPYPETWAFELPGVIRGLRKSYSLHFDEDEYDLHNRLQRCVDMWSVACPFLNKKHLQSSQ